MGVKNVIPGSGRPMFHSPFNHEASGVTCQSPPCRLTKDCTRPLISAEVFCPIQELQQLKKKTWKSSTFCWCCLSVLFLGLRRKGTIDVQLLIFKVFYQQLNAGIWFPFPLITFLPREQSQMWYHYKTGISVCCREIFDMVGS